MLLHFESYSMRCQLSVPAGYPAGAVAPCLTVTTFQVWLLQVISQASGLISLSEIDSQTY